MSPLLKLCAATLVVLLSFIVKTLWDGNYFVDYSSAYTSRLLNCVERRDIGKVEQVIVDKRTGIALLPSSDLWTFIEKRDVSYPPQMYMVNLADGSGGGHVTKVDVVGIDITKVTTLHGGDIYIDKDGRAYLFIVTHTQHYDNTTHGEHVYIFEWKNSKLYFQESITFYHWTSINDITAVGPRSFYVTIDHLFPRHKRGLQTIEELCGFSTGQVDFFDGATNTTQVVVDGIPYANGIRTSLDRSKVYVASSLDPKVRVYSRNLTTSVLKEIGRIPLNGTVDNIYVDEDDQLWLASFPQVARMALAGMGIGISPPQVIRVKLTKEGAVKELETVHFSDGSDISGMTTAVRYKNKIIISGIHQPLVKFCEL